MPRGEHPGLRHGLIVVLLSAAVTGAAAFLEGQELEKPLTYHVKPVKQPIAVDAAWDSEAWRDFDALELPHFMGAPPAHIPRVQAKVAYDSTAVSVIFHVDDRYVRAVAQRHQDAVWKDSCVEFFFTPSNDVSQGYFNLEMNCGGTMLLHYQRRPQEESVRIADEDLARIEVAHSLPKIIDPEITQATTWTVSYRLPLDVFRKYFPAEFRDPAPGATWRANLYKCADDSSHPHWLTWSPVAHPEPDFHRPQSFGTLVFE